MKIKDLVRKNILNLSPYSSARDEYTGEVAINLDANENPFETGLNRYPDPYQTKLKNVLAEIKGISAKNIVVGNGSDEIIDLILRCFCEPNRDELLTVRPSYGMYKVSAGVNAVKYTAVDLNSDFSLNVETLLAAVTENTKVIFLCSPNNPSGNVLNASKIEKVLSKFNGLVVIDEAYIDFADEFSWINRLSKYPQLIVLQTLSKSYGLAGLRIGFAICSEEIVTIINKMKPPYNVSQLNQFKAIECLNQKDNYASNLAAIKVQKVWLKEELQKLTCVQKVYPSDANFFLIKVPDANKMYSYLVENKVVVRSRTHEFNCENCLRITVGTKAENEKLIELLKIYR